MVTLLGGRLGITSRVLPSHLGARSATRSPGRQQLSLFTPELLPWDKQGKLRTHQDSNELVVIPNEKEKVDRCRLLQRVAKS